MESSVIPSQFSAAFSPIQAYQNAHLLWMYTWGIKFHNRCIQPFTLFQAKAS
jgi:hypothetical protein